MFFSLQKSLPLRGNQLSYFFLSFFFQISGTIQGLDICPDMWENVQPEVSKGKSSHGWRYLKVLAFHLNWHSLALYPIELDAQEMLHS